MRKIALALALLFGLANGAEAQAPPAVPALPDSTRVTTYAISGTTCTCSVGFQIYGSGTDVDEWIQVYVNGAAKLSTDPNFGWSLSSATGSLGAIPRPITNAVLTFNSAQTATVVIVGTERPRRLSQFSENRGVAARDLNQAVTDLVAVERELWDKLNRAIVGQPGEVFSALPPPSVRSNLLLGFDNNGLPVPVAGTNNSGFPPGIINTQVSNYTVATSDCGKTIQLGTGATGQFTLTLPAASVFPYPCLIIVKNYDTGRGKILSGNFPSDINTILYPLQTVILTNSGSTAWMTSVAPGRWKLPAATNVYVDNVNGSDTNDGLATGAGGAFRTFPAATAALLDRFDGNNKGVTINLAAGQSWSNLVYNGAPIDVAGVVLDGGGGTITATNPATAALTVITNLSLSGGGVAFGLNIQNMTITCSGGADGLDIEGGTFSVSGGVVFGSCPAGRHVLLNNQARLFFNASYSIIGSAAYHLYAHAGSVFNYVVAAITVTITGTPAWSGAWAGLVEHSLVLLDGVTFSGASTGVRFTLGFGSAIVGVVNTNQSACANLPGNSNGLQIVNSSCQGLPPMTATCTGGTVSPTVNGADQQQWNLTEGTNSTGCVIAFNVFAGGVACTFSSNNATVQASLITSSLNSGGVNFSHTSQSGATIYGVCPMTNN